MASLMHTQPGILPYRAPSCAYPSYTGAWRRACLLDLPRTQLPPALMPCRFDACLVKPDGCIVSVQLGESLDFSLCFADLFRFYLVSQRRWKDVVWQCDTQVLAQDDLRDYRMALLSESSKRLWGSVNVTLLSQ